MDSSRTPKTKMAARSAHEHDQQRKAMEHPPQHPQHGGGMNEYEHHRHAHHPPPPPHMHDFTVMMGEFPPPPPPPPPHHSMMGSYPDPYGMHGPYIPMHPSEAGNEPHNMMDFPPPPPPARFLPPRRMQQRPPRLPNRIIVESSMQHAARGPKSPGGAYGMDNEPATKRKERAPSSSSFPTKLYKILADPQYREYITWLPHGRAWRVLKPKAFEEDVIPKFFRSERYASFMRQVNGWGFRRITEGPDLNAYYHEMFLRGLPQICAGMRRPQKGKTPITPAKDLGQAPDFYKISMFAPLPQVDEDRKRTPKSPGRAAMQQPQETKSAMEQRGPGEAPDTPNEATASSSKVTPDREGQRESNEGDKKAQAVHNSPRPTEAVSSIMPSSASPLSASPNPHSDQFGPALSPSDIGGSFVDVPNSAGNSISSWSEQPEHDILWGSSILNNGHGFSPQASPGGFHFPTSNRGGFPHHHPPQTTSAFGQVTPPENGRPLIPPRGRAGDMMRSIPPMPPSVPNGVDGSGLSPADLSYLTHQNRILLDQARTGSENKKKKH